MARILETFDLTVHFGGVVAVDSVSLAVEQGELVGIVGPNGSGKTTLLNAICGLVPATGRLRIGGVDVRLGQPGRTGQLGLQRTFQTPRECEQLSCLENVSVADRDTRLVGLAGAWLVRPLMSRREKQRISRSLGALERVGLLHRSAVPAAALSYGERRMLELARCLVAQPRVLAMDEPAAGLNAEESRHLGQLLASLAADGLTLIIIEHKIDFLEALCDRVVVLDQGCTIAEGPPAEVWANKRVVDAYLGTAAS